jgi:hypothetical protein
MKQHGKLNGNQSPQRHMMNAKETISKSPVVDGHYSDVKYVTEAAGIAYIAMRNAILNYAIQKEIEMKETPKTYAGMSHLINQLRYGMAYTKFRMYMTFFTRAHVAMHSQFP